MYEDKYSREYVVARRRREALSRKAAALGFACVLVGCLAVAGVVAFLNATSGPVVNTFNPSKVTTFVEEDFKDGVKSNVQVKNTGDVSAYIRALVVVTWKNANGDVLGTSPVAGTDYSIEYVLSNQTDPAGKWTLAADGYYYWSNPVAPQGLTGTLISSCSPVAKKTPDGYFLNVEIITSGIQSLPAAVVETEWQTGVSDAVEGGALAIKTAQGQ